MGGAASTIRTPDQRLRVFVSSTLKELAPERRVTRSVIERLALAPVMFELGARPHPPRSLYRAYLGQSDIFVGIYWESYGWVAPGEELSGLEDEYDLAPDIPMLIYVKHSEQREKRLDALLGRIRDDDRASYVSFEGPEDLAPLITSDLATLLAERFDEGSRRRAGSVDAVVDAASAGFVRSPTSLTRLIGRESELHRVIDLLTTGGRRLVTLIGPGGIGKSRLAMAAARELDATFPDGVAFVDLAPIRNPNLVVSTIATALRIRDTGDAPLQVKLVQALDGRRVLLLLDNVEQVVEAAHDLSALLNDTSVSMLATSRIPLRIDGEQGIPLTPLPASAAIELFIERARAVRPEFEITDDNASEVASIATSLDNVPLALELAAARLRVLTPAALAARLDRALPLLVGGARDRPERQRTMRATIDWSAQLLRDQERELLYRLAVFRNGFALEAAEWMCEDLGRDVAMDLLTGLVESSLVQEEDRGPLSWFSMLATVREYARDELERHGDLHRCKQQHAVFFSGLARRAEPHLIGADQSIWMARLNDELDDIRAAVDHYMSTGQGDAASDLLWPLYWYWWSTGRQREVTDSFRRLTEPGADVSDRTRMRVQLYVEGMALLDGSDPSGLSAFEECAAYFRREQDRFGEFLSQVAIASVELIRGPSGLDAAETALERAGAISEDLDSPFLTAMALQIGGQIPLARGDMRRAIATFDASLDAAKASGDVLSQSAALYQLGWTLLLLGNHGAAREKFVQQMRISRVVEHEQGIVNGLEGMFAVAAATGDLDQAGELLGAADGIRGRRGILGHAMSAYFERALAQVEASPAVNVFHIARERGQRADTAEVIDEALSERPSVEDAREEAADR